MPRLYCCAPYADAAMVRDVHELLRGQGVQPSSRWAEAASGKEPFLGENVMASIAEANDRDLRSSDAVLVIARPGAGAEMYAESRMAIEWGIPVFWVGHRSLSAFRKGVVRCDGITDAIAMIARTFPKDAA